MNGLRQMMMGSLKVASAGSQTLLQTVNVKFSDSTGRNNPSNWALIYNGNISAVLYGTDAIDSNIRVTSLTGASWNWEPESNYPVDADFPAAILGDMVYTNNTEFRDIVFGGMLTANRRYEFIFATYQSSGGDENITKVTHNGTDYITGGSNSILGKNKITIDNPSGGTASFRIQPTNLSQGYACINGLVIKIYSI